MTEVNRALDALLIRYTNQFSDDTPPLPLVEFDSDWPSECVIESGNAPGHYYWKPVVRTKPISFSDLEKAVEFQFRSELSEFYGSFWSNGICVERQDINFSLIQLWNEEDEAQLKENILGHLFAKLKAKLPITYFIGCTFGDEVICLDHESGQVVLEKPGYKAHKVLAASLASFLLELDPMKEAYTA